MHPEYSNVKEQNDKKNKYGIKRPRKCTYDVKSAKGDVCANDHNAHHPQSEYEERTHLYSRLDQVCTSVPQRQIAGMHSEA